MYHPNLIFHYSSIIICINRTQIFQKKPSINPNPNITPHIPTTSSTIVQYPIEEELRGKSITGLSTPNSLYRTTTNYHDLRLTPPARENASLSTSSPLSVSGNDLLLTAKNLESKPQECLK